jgi:membrane protease subunit HflK
MSDNKFKNPWGDDQNDINEVIRKGQEKIAKLFGEKPGRGDDNGGGFFKDGGFRLRFNKNIIIICGVVIFVMWLSTGFYTVQPDEEGVVMRFGKYTRTSPPGLNYKIPNPIETVTPVSVTRINKEEIGFKSAGKTITSKQELLESTVAKESQMLTTDENIVDINFQVQWLIDDAKKFLFNVRDMNTENTVKSVAESAMRESIGLSHVADVLAEKRSEIEQDTKALMQAMLDNYEMGVKVIGVQLLRSDPPQEVLAAYRDVQNAKQDKEREINTALSYRNDIVPRARGESEKMLLDAEGYKNMVVADAQGDAKRFLSVYEQYRNAKDVTRKRMYIETMEEVLSNIDKIIVDKSTSSVIPYLPLSALNKEKEKVTEVEKVKEIEGK